METSAPKKTSFFAKPWVHSLAGILVIALSLAAVLYLKASSASVAIDTSLIAAPIINIGPEAEGILSMVYVHPGDTVTADEPVAQVGSETLSAKIAGLVIGVQNTPGQVFNPGSSVVAMIDPAELRVVGTIDENKGLSRIRVGDPVAFTVDAFGSQTFAGVVDEVAPTSNQSAVVFNISSQRATQQFDIKAHFDTAMYPQLRNGMSARMRVYTQ